jgi:hypothetical protein
MFTPRKRAIPIGYPYAWEPQQSPIIFEIPRANSKARHRHRKSPEHKETGAAFVLVVSNPLVSHE